MLNLMLIIILSFSFILFIVAFVSKHTVLSAFAGIGFILSGLLLFSGVLIVGSVSNVSNSTIIVNSTYVSSVASNNVVYQHSPFDIPIAFTLLLFGLFLLLVSSVALFSNDSSIMFAASNGDDDDG